MTLSTEWTASRKISNRLATLIRQGRATGIRLLSMSAGARRDAPSARFAAALRPASRRRSGRFIA